MSERVIRRSAAGLDVRPGAVVHQLREGVPLTAMQQLGHARVDTTTTDTTLTNLGRRSDVDRAERRRRAVPKSAQRQETLGGGRVK